MKLGLRQDGGFVGEHDRESRMPLPDHISARHEDLPSLIDGMVAFDGGAALSLDPVVAAAVLAFGFVYIHPFEDGNGRIHRYLIHHVLAQRGFNPAGVVFPVSAAILERIDDYRARAGGLFTAAVAADPVGADQRRQRQRPERHSGLSTASSMPRPTRSFSMAASRRRSTRTCRARRIFCGATTGSASRFRPSWTCRIPRSICCSASSNRMAASCRGADARMSSRN